MSLKELIDSSRSDKNTVHSYLDLYQRLLVGKKHSAKNVLEVGIYAGGSIKLWHDFFPNATIYGLDIIHIDNVWDGIKNNDRIKLYTSNDAYDDNFFTNNILNKGVRFDFMLDDGPHTLESMKRFIKLYSQVMTDDGILIIEDVQDWSWIEILKNEVPQHLKKYIKVYDLRPNKGRYDDIVFTINKSGHVPAEYHIVDTQRGLLTRFVSGKYEPTYFITKYPSYISESLLRFGTWDRELIEKAKKFITTDSNCIDISASNGVWSYHLGTHCINGRVLSFEPHVENYNLLCSNMYINGVNNVDTYRLCLSNYSSHNESCSVLNVEPKGTMVISNRTLHYNGWPEEIRLGLERVNYDLEKSKTVFKNLNYDLHLVETVALDMFLDQKRELSTMKIDLIMVNLKNYDLNVLKGMERCLNKSHPRIFTTLYNNQCEQVKKWLMKHGYKMYNVGQDEYMAIWDQNTIPYTPVRCETNDYKFLIILTATIDTHPNVKHLMQRSRDERLEIYNNALEKWSKVQSPKFKVVVVENSGYAWTTPRGIDLYSTKPELASNSTSKGQYELESINFVLNNVDLSQYDYVIKITGRYFIPNFERLLRSYGEYETICQTDSGSRCEIVGARVDLAKRIFEYPAIIDHVEDEYYMRTMGTKRLELPKMNIDPVRNGGGNALVYTL